MECPYCHAQNRDGVRFCNNCGREINPPVTTGGGTSSSRSMSVGSRLQGGRYVVKKVLGQGGMGAALLASDNRLDNKMVVIKELVSDSNDPEKMKEDERNFKREVITLAHLDHPLIPNVTDNFDEGSRYYMVQEYVEGENLEERLDRLQAPMKERDVLTYASQILDVLDYLEQQTPPLVHRDIKPANIIIGAKDKRAHLVDFGIARADEAKNAKRKQTSALGTPGYAPPEQYQGNADPRSDLYALAATMHHLLTNRDPREYPPFVYPPVRSLNPQISPETERVLTRALNNDPNARYQSAAAMKNDIDNILLKRFGVSGNISSYTLGPSGPIGAAAYSAPTVAGQPTASANQQPTVRQQNVAGAQGGRGAAPVRNQPPSYPPPPVSPLPLQPVGKPPRSSGSGVRGAFIVLLLVVFLIFAAGFGLNYLRSRGSSITGGVPTVAPTVSIPANGIGATKVGNDLIGVSNGSVAFDTGRIDASLKQQAAAKVAAGDYAGAEVLFQQAAAQDTNDAEALIYQEDQHVFTSGSPYITIVVGTMLTGTNVGVGRDDLQGAYVAQKQYNDGSKLGGVLVRLLVANSGSSTANNATTVANQIVQAAQHDPTIVGVMGWPFSSHALKAVDQLSQAGIPMVSQTASTDLLTGRSKFFFRVAPSNKAQAIAGAKYVEQTLHAKAVALFFDSHDPYSGGLAQDFRAQFTSDSNQIVDEEQYTVGNQTSVAQAWQKMQNKQIVPDLIYFSGHASDASTLLANLPTTGPYAKTPVMGGDGLYELGGYPSSARAGFSRLHFTAFAYPDEWDVLNLSGQKPRFFADYPNYFDPNRQHTSTPYGYTRPDNDVILSYDAMLAILNGASMEISNGKQSFTPGDLQQALTKINGPNSFQGVSGQIAFGPDGNPVNKAVVILHVSPQGFIQMEPTVLGTFLKK